MELPCLPFSPAEVFVPASSKTLHLYEARFLSLLDEVLDKREKLFAHIVVEPSRSAGGGGMSFVASYGCLAVVEHVRRLQVGALVTVRGIGRLRLSSLTQLEPFLRGTVAPVRDLPPEDEGAVEAAADALKATLADVQRLQIKLKTSGDEPLQTPLERAIQWAEKAGAEGPGASYVPQRAERLSFAAMQPFTGASAAELQKLLQQRLAGMEVLDTLARLRAVTAFAQECRAGLAAKVALQELNL